MSTSQRARSGVPLDQRSALASVPGVPAWGAVAIAVGASFLGFVIDAARGSELTSAFACLYVIGVVAAAVLVRYRGLFTAMVQAPLILFVAVPLSYQYFTDNPGSTLKDILLNVAIPLVNRFPLMLLGTVLALAVGAARMFLKHQASHAPAGAAKRTVRDRAKETRDRARDNREKARVHRARAEEARPRRASDSRAPDSRAPDSRASAVGATSAGGRTSAEGRGRASDARRAAPRPDTKDGEPRGAHSVREPAPRPRRADRIPPAEGRRARRERMDPQFDRPAADPYRPERSVPERSVAGESPRRPVPRPQPPRVPRPPEVDPYSAPRTSAPSGAHIPPHPVPQVRYRDRGDA